MRDKAIVAVCVMIMAMTSGCGKPEPDAAGKGGKRKLGVTFQTMNNPFFVDLNEGLRKVVEAHGDELVTLDAQWDSLKQRNDISDLVNGGAAAIFINPVNWEGIRGSLIQAQKKNIPVIIVDAPVKDKELALSTVASDNVEAGRLAARALVAAGSPKKIGVLKQSLNKACIDRVAGFKEELAKHPEMKIIDLREVKGTTESARPVMRDMIGRFPDLEAIFAINDPTALGAISALDAAGKLKGMKIVAVDGAQGALEQIKAGRMLSTSAQFPKEIGRIAAEAIYKHLDGQKVENDIPVRVELITAENVGKFIEKKPAPAAGE